MSAPKPKARLFVDVLLAGDARLDAGPEHANYLLRVLRLGPQDRLVVFNGRDGEWLARIEPMSRRACRLVLEREVRPQRAERGPWLLFAPLKKTALDFVVEKATELGVDCLWPVVTAHTVVARLNLERLRMHAIEAAEQCERLTIPEVRAPIDLASIADVWPDDRRLMVLDERGGGRPIANVIGDPAATRRCPPPGLLVGPEGGFERSELDGLAALPFVAPVALGPRILRAETAAVAALACWQALAGDWIEPPPARGR